MPFQQKILPTNQYNERLQQFLSMVEAVRGLSPCQGHLQEIMDSVPFKDTEAALQTALYNETRRAGKAR